MGRTHPVVIRIASFNINGINRRWDTLAAWLSAAKPDIVCLQELKSEQGDFPEDALAELGYRAVWVGQRSWNGVAILSRLGEPVLIRTRLPGDPSDTQARYVEAAVAGLVIASIYVPNGNPRPGPKFAYKLAWLERLRRHAATLHRPGRRSFWPVISMSSRQISTSIRRGRGTVMRSCIPTAAQPCAVLWGARGRTVSAIAIPRRGSTASGVISGSDGSAMRAADRPHPHQQGATGSPDRCWHRPGGQGCSRCQRPCSRLASAGT